MSITGPIEDQLAIRALHDNYADAVFRRDAADWGALWADDARKFATQESRSLRGTRASSA